MRIGTFLKIRKSETLLKLFAYLTLIQICIWHMTIDIKYFIILKLITINNFVLDFNGSDGCIDFTMMCLILFLCKNTR